MPQRAGAPPSENWSSPERMSQLSPRTAHTPRDRNPGDDPPHPLRRRTSQRVHGICRRHPRLAGPGRRRSSFKQIERITRPVSGIRRRSLAAIRSLDGISASDQHPPATPLARGAMFRAPQQTQPATIPEVIGQMRSGREPKRRLASSSASEAAAIRSEVPTQYGRMNRRSQRASLYACRFKISRTSCVTPSGYRSSIANRSARSAVVR
jgi:hypothetical protein